MSDVSLGCDRGCRLYVVRMYNQKTAVVNHHATEKMKKKYIFKINKTKNNRSIYCLLDDSEEISVNVSEVHSNIVDELPQWVSEGASDFRFCGLSHNLP